MEKLISKAELSRLCNVSVTAICKACKTNLIGSLVGKRVNLMHKSVLDYIEVKAPENVPYFEEQKIVETAPITGKKAANETKKQESLNSQNDIMAVPENIEKFADYTLRELINQFGTDIAFCDWLKATKSIEDINEKRMKASILKGELVSRKLVKIGILDPMNSAHTRMLTDGSKTIAKRLIAKHEAGDNIQELELFVSDQISSYLKPMKNNIKRTLSNFARAENV